MVVVLAAGVLAMVVVSFTVAAVVRVLFYLRTWISICFACLISPERKATYCTVYMSCKKQVCANAVSVAAQSNSKQRKPAVRARRAESWLLQKRSEEPSK